MYHARGLLYLAAMRRVAEAAAPLCALSMIALLGFSAAEPGLLLTADRWSPITSYKGSLKVQGQVFVDGEAGTKGNSPVLQVGYNLRITTANNRRCGVVLGAPVAWGS